jgi:hypothetical protein
MRDGLLWHDKSDRELNAKIERAAQYYQSKYETRPTLVFVHPTELLKGPATLEDIEVRATNSVLPGHFWLGVKDQSKASAS